MRVDEGLRKILGFDSVMEHFGRWPSFHDAEVVSVSLNRNAESYFEIHAFNMQEDLDCGDRYRTDKHAIVRFTFKEVVALELYDFNHLNVLSGLELRETEQGFVIKLGCCFGLCGTIEAHELRLAVVPGIPEGSIYARAAAGE